MAIDFQLSARLKDGLPIVTPVMINATCGSSLLADMLSFAAAYLPLLAAITQSDIVESRLSVEVNLPTLPSGRPVALSKNSDAALLDYGLAGTTDHLGLSIPNFIPAGYLAAVPSTVNPANTDVAAFNTFLNSITNTVNVQNGFDKAVSGFLGGKVATRKHRRQVSRAKSAP